MKITQSNVWRLALGAVFSLVLVVENASADEISSGKSASRSASSGDPARGEMLFRSVCGGYCHAMEPGKREAPYLFDCDWKHGGTDAKVFHTIYAGVPGTRMISFGGKLPEGDSDIWGLGAFLRRESQCNKMP